MVGVDPKLTVEVRFLGGVPQRPLGVVIQGKLRPWTDEGGIETLRERGNAEGCAKPGGVCP